MTPTQAQRVAEEIVTNVNMLIEQWVIRERAKVLGGNQTAVRHMSDCISSVNITLTAAIVAALTTTETEEESK